MAATTIMAQRLFMSSMVGSVCTEIVKVVSYFTPACWEVAVCIPVSTMFYMMVLANVEGFVVSLAVGGMVADGLHAKLLTLLDHDVCVGATCLSG